MSSNCITLIASKKTKYFNFLIVKIRSLFKKQKLLFDNLNLSFLKDSLFHLFSFIRIFFSLGHDYPLNIIPI